MVGDMTYHNTKENKTKTFKGRVNFTKLNLITTKDTCYKQ